MTARIKQAGLPLLAVALTTGVIGYILGGTREQRETNAQAAARSTASPVKANVDRDAY